MSEKKMKSALELAMERFDAESGAAPRLSDEQKAAIAEIEKRTQAKLAEMQIMHQKNLAEAAGDYAQIIELEEAMRSGKLKLEESAEEEKQAVRKQ